MEHTEPAEALVRPNSKYDKVFGTSYGDYESEPRVYDGRRYEEERAVLDDVNAEVEEFADSYTVADPGTEAEPALTWDDFTLTTDPDLLRALATWFEGVSSSENPESIRQRLRTGDPEWYANVYIVERNRDSHGETTPTTETTTTETTETTDDGGSA